MASTFIYEVTPAKFTSSMEQSSSPTTPPPTYDVQHEETLEPDLPTKNFSRRLYHTPAFPSPRTPTRRSPLSSHTDPWILSPSMLSTDVEAKPGLKRKASPTLSLPKRSLHDSPDPIASRSEGKVREDLGILDKYSLFPLPLSYTLPSAQAPIDCDAEDPGKVENKSHHKLADHEDISAPPTKPPTRPLPPLPSHAVSSKPFNYYGQSPPRLEDIHPALRDCWPRPVSDPTSDTGSIPICLQVRENGVLPGPPSSIKPLLSVTSLLIVRQDLEAKLRGLEAILGRYGASIRHTSKGEITPPPAYRVSSFPPAIGAEVMEAAGNRAARRRRRSDEAAILGKRNPHGKEEETSYSTRPRYGKNLEHIFGAKHFEFANSPRHSFIEKHESTSLSVKSLFRRSRDRSQPPSENLLEAPLLYATPPASPTRSQSGKEARNSITKSSLTTGMEEKLLQSPSYTRTVEQLRIEYQETELYLAETELEIELVYLRGDIEQLRQRKEILRAKGEIM